MTIQEILVLCVVENKENDIISKIKLRSAVKYTNLALEYKGVYISVKTYWKKLKLASK